MVLIWFLLLFFLIKESFECQNLKKTECINKKWCGWLGDRTNRLGKCYPGTPVGPLNPKFQQAYIWTYNIL
jgi:hypothetical protein